MTVYPAISETAATSGRLDGDDDVTIRVEDDRDDVNIRVDDDVKADADRAADKTKNAAERAADKTVEGTKKVGSEIKDVFTDDDKDSDRDGK